MKKLTAMMLVLACFLALTGCKPAQPGSTTALATAAPTTAVPQTTAAPPTTVPPTTAPDPATFTEVWETFDHGDFRDPWLPRVDGVSLYTGLDVAMQTFSDPNYVFPLYVDISPNEASKEEVYEAIFKPFITYDELICDSQKNNEYKVFLNAEQIAALKCPDGFYANIYNDRWREKGIFEDTVDEITAATKQVQVEFECAYGNSKEENEALIRKAADEIIADHGITEDMVYYRPAYSASFKAVLDKGMIARLLEDPRIERIIDIDYEGSDYVLVDRASGSIEYFFK